MTTMKQRFGRAISTWCFMMVGASVSWAQTVLIEEELRDGNLPAGWVAVDIEFRTTAGGFALMETTGAIITTPMFDAEAYEVVRIEFSVAKFGSGSDGPITVEYSLNAGSTWVVAGDSETPTSATYIDSTALAGVTSDQMQVRFTRPNSPSQKRLRDVVIKGFSSATVLTLSIPETVDQGKTVQGAVSLVLPAEGDVDVDLTSSKPADMQVPASVTILDGATSASFDITASPISEPGPNFDVAITAEADGYDLASEEITVINTVPVPISLASEGYMEDFADFVSELTLPHGWSVAGNITSYEGNWGTGFVAGLRGNSTVLGYQHAGNTDAFEKIVTFRNDTGEVITELTISYLGRVERVIEGRTPSYTVRMDEEVVPALAYSTGVGADEQRTVFLNDLSIATGDTFQIVWTSDGSEAGSPGQGSRRQIGIGDFSILVGDPLSNFPPTITLDPPGASKHAFEGDPINFEVIADQVPGDAGQETILMAVEWPAGSTFPGASGPAPIQSTFDWTPEVTGVFTAVFTAADADGVTTQAVTITVFPDPDTPIPIAPGMPVSEDFDVIGSALTAILSAGWKVDRRSAVREVGTFANAGHETDWVGGNNMSGGAVHGIYNFGAPETGGDDRSVGFLATGSGTRSGSLYVRLINEGTGAISRLHIDYNIEKYRDGSNDEGFRIQLYHSTDGDNWTNAGPTFLTTFEADPVTQGFDMAPGETVSVSGTLNLSATPIGVDGHVYLAWNYSVRNGTGTANAQALAVDDVVISVADEPPETEIGAFVVKPGASAAASFISVTGREYLLQYTTNLLMESVVWEETASATGDGGEITLNDDNPTDVMRIYRVIDVTP